MKDITMLHSNFVAWRKWHQIYATYLCWTGENS